MREHHPSQAFEFRVGMQIPRWYRRGGEVSRQLAASAATRAKHRQSHVGLEPRQKNSLALTDIRTHENARSHSLTYLLTCRRRRAKGEHP